MASPNPTPNIDAMRAERKGPVVAKVPVVMQMEALECGAACLTMVLASYGKWVPLEQVRSDCGVSRDGTKASNVVKAARALGLESKGFRWEPEAFFENATFPCIVHWNFNHFVVVRGYRGNSVLLADPARGHVTVSKEEFDRSFTGIALLFAPGENFVADGKKKSIGRFVKNRLAGTVSITLFAVAIATISALLGMGAPLLMDDFFNQVLGPNAPEPELLGPLLAFMTIIAIAQTAVGFLNVHNSIRISNELNAASSMAFLWHVFHLPMEFFSQRQSADISNRMSLNGTVSESLINTFAPLVLSIVTAVIYLVMMIKFSPILAAVGVLSVAINVVMARLATNKRISLTKTLLRDIAQVQSATASGIQMIETIKAAGAEEGFFARWAGQQANASNATNRILRETLVLSTMPSLVSSLANVAIMLIGVALVMRGQFLIGSIYAFQGILSQFTGPSTQIITAAQTIAEMRTNMERIDDVMEYPEQVTFAPANDDSSQPEQKLQGSVEFKDVSFGYSRLDKPLLEHFNLKLSPGEQVAIVGLSGCGKSTVAKLAMGLFQPWSGEILFDGKPLSAIQADVFFSSVAMVEQEVVLFADTISNNIKMWDATISDAAMYQAAKDAQIHSQIMERPGAYSCMLRENGADLSGGERQRIEIARVLSQEPTIIVLDEATSALDAKTERDVVEALRKRGLSTIVVAHRLSTVRYADRIIVLKNGHIAEQGTHDELIAANGLYAELVLDD